MADPTPPPAAEPVAAPPAAEPVAAPAAAAEPVAAPAAEPTPWFQNHDDTWREQIAGDDPARLKQLLRFTDPSAMANSFFEGQSALSRRMDIAAETLPENPTAEQVTAYREKHGIPAEAKDYELTLSEGLVLSEEDRAEFQPVFEAMHEMNMPPDQVSRMTDTWLKVQNQIVAAEEAQDSVEAANCTKALQDAWKGDYETNKNLVVSMLNSHLPADQIDGFMNARLSDGTALFNSPGIVAALSNMARTINPAATLVPAGKDALTSIDTRLKELRGMMGEPDWHKKTALHKEFQDLTTAQEQFSARQS